MTEGVQDDLSKEIIDGRVGKVEEVAEAITNFIAGAQTMSLFGDKKTVWLKDASFFGDGNSVQRKAPGRVDRLKAF